MSDPNIDPNDPKPGDPKPDDPRPDDPRPDDPKPSPDDDLIARLVAEKVAEEVKSLKSKLDSAYSVRDEALKRASELEKAEREAALKKLDEEGKHKEAYEMRLLEKDAAYNELVKKLSDMEKRNVELTRDSQVRDLLGVTKFRNEKAANMAFHEITSQLIRNDKGEWTHRSGVSLGDFVKSFVSDDANSFLLEAKPSSGSGLDAPKPTPGSQKTSLFAKPLTEVLNLAAEGKIPRR